MKDYEMVTGNGASFDRETTVTPTLAGVTVHVADVRTRWSEQMLNRLLAQLPVGDHRRAIKFRRWLDVQMNVAGRLMIGAVLRRNPTDTITSILSEVTTSPALRPSLPSGPDFNLSHSAGIVMLAAAERTARTRVGVDVEAISDGWREIAREVLTRNERRRLSSLAYPEYEFYRIWTYKEAVIKADGRGLAVPLSRLSSLGDSVQLEGMKWYVKPIVAPHDFAAHLATSSAVTVRMETVVDVSELIVC